MNKALVLLALLAVGFAVSTERVEQNNAADALVDEVTRMEQSIRQEQQQHDELAAAQDAECVQEYLFRQQEINDAQAAADAADAARGRCENALVASHGDLEKSRNHVVNIQEILQALSAQRLAEHNSFNSLVNDELDPAIQAVQGAYPILRDFASQSVGFVQFSNHINKMFTSMVKANKVTSFTSILTVLLQQPNFQHGIGHDVIEQLEVLFEQLEEDLLAAKDHAIEVENAAVAKYDQTVNEYDAILATLNATIASLEGYISYLETCVQNESQVSAQANAKKLRNAEALQFAVDMCSAFEQEYNNSTAARNEELALLGKLKAFVRQQEEIFGNYGNDGVNAYDQYKAQWEASRQENRNNFMQMKIKQFKLASNLKKTSAAPTKCTSCSRKSFVQKKLGF